MKRLAFAIAVAVVALYAAAPAFAYRMEYTRPCFDGIRTWTFWAEYDDNTCEMTRCGGTYCDGTPFASKPANVLLSPTNPLGITSQFYDPSPNGAGWCRLNFDDDGNVLQCWGQTADGQFYQINEWMPDDGVIE